MASCSGCTVTWRHSDRIGHCSACHETFSGIGAFDRHQTIEDGRNRCHDPRTVPRSPNDRTLRFEPLTTNAVMKNGVFWRLRPTAADVERQKRFIRRVKEAS